MTSLACFDELSASLVGVKSRFGNPIRFWDDGIGPVWVYRESLGVMGVVRAQTWETAFECCQDEIMSDADPDDKENWPTTPDGEFPEGIGYRSSGVPSNDGLDSPLYAEDLNGCALDLLTSDLLAALEITLAVESEDGDANPITFDLS